MEGKANDPRANERVEIPECAPIYTKEMHEAGELPPVGSEAQFFSDGYSDNWLDWCIYHGKATDGSYIIEHHHVTSPERVAACLFEPNNTIFKPIDTRTGEEKLIDELIKDVDAANPNHQLGVALNSLASQLIAIGYRKP